MGYVVVYVTDDDERVSEGIAGFRSRKEARDEINRHIEEADLVLARIPNYPSYDGEMGGERIVLRNVDNEMGNERISILWYGGDKHFRFIVAPSWNLALEFEEFLIDTQYPNFRDLLRSRDREALSVISCSRELPRKLSSIP